MGAGGTRSHPETPKEIQAIQDFMAELARNNEIRDCGIRLGRNSKSEKSKQAKLEGGK